MGRATNSPFGVVISIHLRVFRVRRVTHEVHAATF